MMSFSYTEILLCVLGVLVLHYFWTRRFLYYYSWNIPGPLGLPIIGSTYYFFGPDTYQRAAILFDTYKDICKFWLANRPVFAVVKPEYLQIVMKNALEKGESYKFVKSLFGRGLPMSQGDLWKRHRRTIAPVFSQQTLNSFFDIYMQHTNELMKKLEEIPERVFFDCYPLVHHSNMDKICHIAMGLEDTLSDRNDYVRWIDRVAEIPYQRSFNVFLHPEFIWNRTALAKEFESLIKKSYKYVSRIIDERRKKHIPGENHVLLDHLIELTDEDGKWTNEELMEEVQTIILTGSETTSSTISFCLLLLGMNKNVQRKLHRELDTVFQQSERELTLNDLSKLVYLEQVIKETMRLFPTLMIIGRNADQNLTLGPYTIPKGCEVVIPILFLHRNPQVWPDPLKFDPDRFLPEKEKERHPYSYIPLSAGIRNCIGNKYAFMDVKMVVASVMRKFKVFTRDFKSVGEIELKGHTILARSSKDFYISFEKRN